MKKQLQNKIIDFQFHTTYFANLRHLEENYVPISMCIWDPKWYPGENHKYGMTNKEIPKVFIPQIYDPNLDCETCVKIHDKKYYNLNCHYLNNYTKQLSKINVENTINILLDRACKYIENYKINLVEYDVIYLCFTGYEAPSKLCSERFILSNFLNNNNWFIKNFKEIKEFLK